MASLTGEPSCREYPTRATPSASRWPVNDKAAFRTHWAEFCEIPGKVSITKLGSPKPGEQGSNMATNEHHPRGSGHIENNQRP